MAKKLTADLLQGTSFKTTVKVDFLGETYEVDIQPLNNEQAGEVERLMQDGVDVKMKPGMKGKMQQHMDIDTKKQLTGKQNADVKAVAFGTVDKGINEEFVSKQFPAKLIRDIAKEVRLISGIGNKKEIEEFVEGEENPSHKDGKQ